MRTSKSKNPYKEGMLTENYFINSIIGPSSLNADDELMNNFLDFIKKTNDNFIFETAAIRVVGNKDNKNGRVSDFYLQDKLDQKINFSIKTNNSKFTIKSPRMSDDFIARWTDDEFKTSQRTIDSLNEFDLTHEVLKGLWVFRNQKLKRSLYKKKLHIFREELLSQFEENGKRFVQKFFKYMVGYEDFYQINFIREEFDVKRIKLNIFNFNGSLPHIKKRLPTSIEDIAIDGHKMQIHFNSDWKIGFRIKNDSPEINKRIDKMDVTLDSKEKIEGKTFENTESKDNSDNKDKVKKAKKKFIMIFDQEENSDNSQDSK